VDAYRTPDERFEGLPGFDFEPRYAEIDGLRLARVDEGAGAPVVFFHGEPTWSYLWRKVIPSVRDAGYRCIAPDYPGFGRSDKPTDLGWYTYDRHVEVMGALLDELEIRDATAVVHDWGGPIGLRLAAERPELFSRMVVMETGLFTGEQPMSEAWFAFRDFMQRTDDPPISMLVRNAVARGMSDEVAAAYDAPFPVAESKAGARAFPLLLATSPEMPGAAAGKRAQEALVAGDRPMLILWADSDPILPFKVGEAFATLMNVEGPRKVENASHFLQEDAGEEIGAAIADWLDDGTRPRGRTS
jgi:haloalkane dehalogenase